MMASMWSLTFYHSVEKTLHSFVVNKRNEEIIFFKLHQCNLDSRGKNIL